jgi:hypothetical protein
VFRAFPLFARTTMTTDCEICGQRFDMMAGGVCARCRRVLCGRHLHGSWLRRLAVDFGAESLCLACRAGGDGAAEDK